MIARAKVKATIAGALATVVLAMPIVVGSRNLQHFDAALVGYTFATLFAVNTRIQPGGSASIGQTISVSNVAPTVEALTLEAVVTDANGVATVYGRFTDPGLWDTR